MIVGKQGLLVTNSHNTDVALFPEDRFRDVDVKKEESRITNHGRRAGWGKYLPVIRDS